MSKKIEFPLYQGLPFIRILLFKNRKHIDIKISNRDFQITDLQGTALFEEVENDKFWRVKVKEAEPAEYQYFLMLREARSKPVIESDYDELRAQGHAVTSVTVGGDIFLDEQLVNHNEKHIILAGPFRNEKEARRHSHNYGYLNHCRIHRKQVKPARATVEIYDPTCENFAEIQGGIKLIPKNPAAYFELCNFEIKQEAIHKPQRENLFYSGHLIIRADEDNTLIGINEIDLENYLKGVLHSEMDGDISLPYAKSLAIVVRSQIIARYGQYHTAEDFDFCSEGHCLRYYGRKDNDPIITQALKETKGLVLKRDKKVCNAYFSYCCGGHTENASDIWFVDEEDCSAGKYDGETIPRPKPDLTEEANVEQWILDRPDVYCRQEADDQSHLTRVGSDAFRWEIFYTRQELEEILYDKTGRDRLRACHSPEGHKGPQRRSGGQL